MILFVGRLIYFEQFEQMKSTQAILGFLILVSSFIGTAFASARFSSEADTYLSQLAEREEGPWFAVHQGYEIQLDSNRGDPDLTLLFHPV